MTEFLESPTNFYLGRNVNPETGEEVRGDVIYYDSRDLTTHAVVVGMTGSGKTGLCIDILEEAVIDGIPAIVVDPKGDITNLLLTFPDLSPQSFKPWVNPDDATRAAKTLDDYAASVAEKWRSGLTDWGIGEARIDQLKRAAQYSIYTPGSDAGLPISILQSLKAPIEGWVGNEEMLRERISGTVTALLALIGVDAKPVEDREHILLSNIFENGWKSGQDLTLESLILQTQRPPFSKLGVFDIETLFPEKDRFKLAKSLNNIIAAPQFQSWITGEPLDVGSLLFTPEGRPRVSVLYIAHLNDAERMFILTLLLESVLSWMRGLQGSTSLRALLYIDEVFGMFPPYPYNPPTKDPMLRLLKQARAFGLGIVLATQNPGDLDYKSLSNAGTWVIGKLQTDNDKQRILEGLDSVRDAQSSLDVSELSDLISRLNPRQFILHNVHDPTGPHLMHTRWAMSYLRGPITRQQIGQLMAAQKQTYRPGEVIQATQTATVAQGFPTPSAGVPPLPPQPAPQAPAPSPPPQQPQPAARAAPAPADLPPGFSQMPPVLPSTVAQYYVPTEYTVERSVSSWEQTSGSAAMNVETRKRLLYRPVLLAQSDVRFEDKKTQTTESRTFTFLVPSVTRTGRIKWEEYAVSPFDPDRLEPHPLTDAFYADLPSALTDATLLKQMQTDMMNWIYQNASIKVLWNPTLKLGGEIGGSRRDFLVRVQGVARQKRDEEADKVADRYDKKLESLEEKAMIKTQRLEDKRAELDARKREELISGAETLMQLMKGRSYYALSRTSRLRRYTNTSTDQVGTYQQQLVNIIDDLDDTEAEMEQALQAVQEKWANIAADVQELAITPYKKDIHVELFGLGWVPYWDVIINGQTVVLPATEIGSRG
jgi:hypothetical protein